MPRRLFIALLTLVAAPLVLLGWLSASAYRRQQESAREELVFLYQSRLDDHDRSLQRVFAGYARQLESELEQDKYSIATLRKMDRENPVVRQTMFVGADGSLLYPPKPGIDASDAAALYASMPAITHSKPSLAEPESPEEPLKSAGTPRRGEARKTTSPSLSSMIKGGSFQTSKQAATSRSRRDTPPQPPIAFGSGNWQVWYMDEGLQLIYWVPRTDGTSVGILLERARWVADLTACLPNSGTPLVAKESTGRRTGFTALVDEAKQFVYRWGDNDAPCLQPLAERTLTWPLTSWELEFHSDDPLPGSVALPLIVSLAGIATLLVTLGAYVLTGVQRQMRAARNRVSFASQVSHELRTPLTNIRLYAELAETDLTKLPPGSSRDSIEKRLQVIDTESRRLGRLVSGVLEMIRDQRKPSGPRLTTTVPDEVIEQSLLQFAPSFSNAGLLVERDLHADQEVALDADILEMILVNLLSNVLKYASSGKYVRVSSELRGDQLRVRIADQGPGIPRRKSKSIFRPFYRLNDSISAPSGTGIGLTIARRLAHRHGGQLQLIQEVPCQEQGACFELQLPVQPGAQDEKSES